MHFPCETLKQNTLDKITDHFDKQCHPPTKEVIAIAGRCVPPSSFSTHQHACYVFMSP